MQIRQYRQMTYLFRQLRRQLDSQVIEHGQEIITDKCCRELVIIENIQFCYKFRVKMLEIEEIVHCKGNKLGQLIKLTCLSWSHARWVFIVFILTMITWLLYLPCGYLVVTVWLPCGYHAMWLTCGYHVVTMWLTCGNYVFTMWLPYGYHVVTMWLPCGLDTMWLTCGYHVVTMWLPGNVVTMWLPCG